MEVMLKMVVDQGGNAIRTKREEPGMRRMEVDTTSRVVVMSCRCDMLIDTEGKGR